ncbi:MAG: hypothetical protein ABR541_06385 [Candidatus Dormibacteria bacterium]
MLRPRGDRARVKIPWLGVALGIGFLGILIAVVAVRAHSGGASVATSNPGLSVSTPAGGQASGGQPNGSTAQPPASSGAAGSSGAPTLPDSSPGTISKAFAFTLNGTPPPGESFVLVFDHGTVDTVTLCGGAGAPDCTGNGQQLGQAFANLQPHAGGAFRFERHSSGGRVNAFFSGTDPMSNSSTITAYFNE